MASRSRSAGILLHRRAPPAQAPRPAQPQPPAQASRLDQPPRPAQPQPKAGETLEVLLVHPGGPLWARRDLGAWSIPKGEYKEDEDPLAAARREFAEELGASPPEGPAEDLGEVRQKSGKLVRAWAVAGDLDVTGVKSNTFTLEWPPRSGRQQEFPEVDRAEWFDLPLARTKIIAAQATLLDRLEKLRRR